MVVGSSYCERCGHPEGSIAHNPDARYFQDRSKPVCNNCSNCKNPFLYHQMEIMKLNMQVESKQ